MFGNYSMLISILIFAGGAVVVEWILRGNILKKHLKLILVIVILSSVFTILGLEWMEPKKWDYGKDTTFYTTFLGSEVELYLLAILSYVAISQAVIILTDREDNGEPLLKTFRLILNKIVK